MTFELCKLEENTEHRTWVVALHNKNVDEKEMEDSRPNNPQKPVPGDTSVVAMEMRSQKTTDCVDMCKNGPGTKGRGCEDVVLSEDMQRGQVSLGLRDDTHLHSHSHTESGLSWCLVTHGHVRVEKALSLYVRGIKGGKMRLRRAHSASVYIKPNCDSRPVRTSEMSAEDPSSKLKLVRVRSNNRQKLHRTLWRRSVG